MNVLYFLIWSHYYEECECAQQRLDHVPRNSITANPLSLIWYRTGNRGKKFAHGENLGKPLFNTGIH